ncbi:hypothetical protein JCM3765_005529 [Sporobolomyces pararoseus]
MLRVLIFLTFVCRVIAGDIPVTAQREVASDGEVVISWSSDSPTYTVRVVINQAQAQEVRSIPESYYNWAASEVQAGDQVQFYVYDSAGNAGVTDPIPVVESYDSPNDGSSKTTGAVVVGPKETQSSTHKGKTTAAAETGAETGVIGEETSDAVETSSVATAKHSPNNTAIVTSASDAGITSTGLSPSASETSDSSSSSSSSSNNTLLWVGVGAVVLALILGIAFFFWWRQRSQSNASTSKSNDATSDNRGLLAAEKGQYAGPNSDSEQSSDGRSQLQASSKKTSQSMGKSRRRESSRGIVRGSSQSRSRKDSSSSESSSEPRARSSSRNRRR